MRIGIEQEFVFKDRSGRYLDCGNSEYSLFSQVVDRFPLFDGDDAWFECKSLETHPKRCYVEGFERHGPDGAVLETLPKGLEIRTLPHETVAGVLDEFRDSYATVMESAGRLGLFPVLISRHPFKLADNVDLALTPIESAVRTPAELAIAVRATLTHGLHVTVSVPGRSRTHMEDLLRKVNHYLPSLIPYSFSSPFYEGRMFDGLCSRNYYRAETRRMASLEARKSGLVLEFRAFDACGDSRLLTAVLTLFRGFVLDETLPGRDTSQDPDLVKQSSLAGFDDAFIEEQGLAVLGAARMALRGESGPLDLLETMLRERDCYAARMKRRFSENADLMACISDQYDF